MFLSRNKKNNVYPCKPQFYYIKVGFNGVKIIQACFRDVLYRLVIFVQTCTTLIINKGQNTCFELEFYSPVNIVKVMSRWSTKLLTLFLDMLYSPLSGLAVLCPHTFASNLQLPCLNQWKGENDRRNYFINQSKWKLCGWAGIRICDPWICGQMRCRLCYGAHQKYISAYNNNLKRTN